MAYSPVYEWVWNTLKEEIANNVDFVSSRRRNRIIGSIVTAVILCGIAYFVFGYLMQTDDPKRQKDSFAEVLESTGEVQIVRNFKNIPSESGLIVMSWDFFRTKGGDARVRIKDLNDKTTLAIGNNSNVIFNAINNGERMNLGNHTSHNKI